MSDRKRRRKSEYEYIGYQEKKNMIRRLLRERLIFIGGNNASKVVAHRERE